MAGKEQSHQNSLEQEYVGGSELNHLDWAYKDNIKRERQYYFHHFISKKRWAKQAAS